MDKIGRYRLSQQPHQSFSCRFTSRGIKPPRQYSSQPTQCSRSQHSMVILSNLSHHKPIYRRLNWLCSMFQLGYGGVDMSMSKKIHVLRISGTGERERWLERVLECKEDLNSGCCAWEQLSFTIAGMEERIA